MEKFSVENLVRGKKILDIGCGSYQFYYKPESTRERTAIDTSPEMVETSKKLYPTSLSLVASAHQLPFPDKTFDVVTFFFVLHHIEPSQWEKALAEAARVSKTVLILDHTLNDNILAAGIQKLYWNFFDGGKVYQKNKKWTELLTNFKIIEHQRKGLLFRNICYYHCVPKNN